MQKNYLKKKQVAKYERIVYKNAFSERVTAWKVSKYGDISSPNTGKYGPEIILYLDTFHAVSEYVVSSIY